MKLCGKDFRKNNRASFALAILAALHGPATVKQEEHLDFGVHLEVKIVGSSPILYLGLLGVINWGRVELGEEG